MKRTVTVRVGVPKEFPQAGGCCAHGSECFSIDFTDGDRGFTAQCLCLCKLKGGDWIGGNEDTFLGPADGRNAMEVAATRLWRQTLDGRDCIGLRVESLEHVLELSL
jgi:hypothetical protein